MKNILAGLTLAVTSFLYAEEKEASVVEEGAVDIFSQVEDPEWQKLKGAAGEYVKAFNSRDAKAIAELFAEDGEILLFEDVKLVGRDAIEQHYTRVFDSNPDSKVGVEATSVRFITPSLVVEEGRVVFGAGEEVLSTHHYVAIIAKQESGEWRIVQSRNREKSDTEANDHLSEMEGIVGDWVAKLGDASYKIDFRWDPSGAWLIGKGRYSSPDTEPVHTTTRIGWDSSLAKIVSWSFDSMGGFSKSVWTKSDSMWVMEANGVNGVGEFTSSNQSVAVEAARKVVWKFTNRVIGDALEDDFEMRLVKTPPKPFTNPQSE